MPALDTFPVYQSFVSEKKVLAFAEIFSVINVNFLFATLEQPGNYWGGSFKGTKQHYFSHRKRLQIAVNHLN